MSCIPRPGYVRLFLGSLTAIIVLIGLLDAALPQSLQMLNEREYRKERRKAKKAEREDESIRASFLSGDTAFSDMETSHDFSRKFFKFTIVCAESGERRNCYLRRNSTSLKKTLDSLSRGDGLIVHGKMEAYETKGTREKKLLELRMHTLSRIFVVDRIRKTDD